MVVATYNRPDALSAVLEGLVHQNDRAFEVIIADDGSTPDTGGLVKIYAERAPFPVRHVWHEDAGFRAGAIRNRAVAVASSDYVLFLDGDCVPRPDLVAAHRRLRSPGTLLYGHRVLVGPELTRRALATGLPLHAWGFREFLGARLAREINRMTPLLPWPAALALPHRSWKGIKACHLSAWRGDLIRVNGFDEVYEGWGFEDSDLVARLFHAGVRARDARGAPAVLHLWHPDNPRAQAHANEALFRQRLRDRPVRAARGLDQYL